MQVQGPAMCAKQYACMDQHGAASERKRGAIQRLPAPQQRPGQGRRCGEVKHDGEQGKKDDGSHSARVWHGPLGVGSGDAALWLGIARRVRNAWLLGAQRRFEPP